jgi:L-fuculose-phosphate aldolase
MRTETTHLSPTLESEPASFVLGKEALKENATRSLDAAIVRPERSLREKVALTCQILFDFGHDSGLAGQITARGERPGTYLTQPLGLGFDEITADKILVVDEDLNILENNGIPNPANRFHSWIYRARPDVNCIVHTHPMHVCALSITGTRLHVAQMDACMLYDEIAFLSEWPGVPVGNEEGRIIVEALGAKRVLILAHHGLVVAAGSIEEACIMAVQCERAARMQLLAQSAGAIRELDPDLAREAHDWALHERRLGATFDYFARRSARMRR